MNTEKAVLSSIPCAFKPELNVTNEFWTITLVRKEWKRWNLMDFFTGAQHANLIVQSLENGKVLATKLHLTKLSKTNLDDRTCGLHIQVINNESAPINIAIIDERTLHHAVKRILSSVDAKDSSLAKLSLSKHWAHETWLVKKETAVKLMSNIHRDQEEFLKNPRSFWWFGDKSIVHQTSRQTKLGINKLIDSRNAKICAVALGGIILLCSTYYIKQTILDQSRISNLIISHHDSQLTQLDQLQTAVNINDSLNYNQLVSDIFSNKRPLEASSLSKLPEAYCLHQRNLELTALTKTQRVDTLTALNQSLATDFKHLTANTSNNMMQVEFNAASSGLMAGLYGLVCSVFKPRIKKTDVGHNCLTWAIEKLLELNEESISQNLQRQGLDVLVSMGTNHIKSNHRL